MHYTAARARLGLGCLLPDKYTVFHVELRDRRQHKHQRAGDRSYGGCGEQSRYVDGAGLVQAALRERFPKLLSGRHGRDYTAVKWRSIWESGGYVGWFAIGD